MHTWDSWRERKVGRWKKYWRFSNTAAAYVRSCSVSRAATPRDSMAHRELNRAIYANESGVDAGVVADVMGTTSFKLAILVERGARDVTSAFSMGDTEVTMELRTSRRVYRLSAEGSSVFRGTEEEAFDCAY